MLKEEKIKPDFKLLKYAFYIKSATYIKMKTNKDIKNVKVVSQAA